eukprot:1134024-Pyramimonas_sp.AAC.1
MPRGPRGHRHPAASGCNSQARPTAARFPPSAPAHGRGAWPAAVVVCQRGALTWQIAQTYSSIDFFDPGGWVWLEQIDAGGVIGI